MDTKLSETLTEVSKTMVSMQKTQFEMQETQIGMQNEIKGVCTYYLYKLMSLLSSCMVCVHLCVCVVCVYVYVYVNTYMFTCGGVYAYHACN